MAPTAPQDVPTTISAYCRAWLGGEDETYGLSEYGVQTAVILAFGYKPRNAVEATCITSGTDRFRRVGYGSLSRLVCLDCGTKVTTTNAGLVRKHPRGGKAGILTGPRDQAARTIQA